MKVYFGGDLSYKDIVYSFLKKNMLVIEVDSLREADLIYWVYGNGPALNFKNLKFWVFSRNQKLILHWIGTDVLNHLIKIKSKKLKSRVYYRIWNYLILRKIKNKAMFNFCCAPWLCEELEGAGIISSYLPLTTIKKELFDFPEKGRDFDFMSYLPQGRMDLYNGEYILNIARQMTESKFAIIIPDINSVSELKLVDVPANVIIFPRIEFSKMTEIYRNSKCFIRLTKHDGLSLSVMESLANRLQVFWTYDFPHVHKVNINDEKGVLESLKLIINSWSPNNDGQTYVLNNLNLPEIEKQFTTYFLKIYGNDN